MILKLEEKEGGSMEPLKGIIIYGKIFIPIRRAQYNHSSKQDYHHKHRCGVDTGS